MGDINNVVYLEQNLTKWSEKLDDLDRQKLQVEGRSERYLKEMNGWVKDVKDEKRKMKEIESKFKALKIYNFKGKKQLNDEVIFNLNVTNKLIERGNACPKSIRAFLSEMEFCQPREFLQAEIISITSNLNNIIRSDDLFGKVYKGKLRDGKQLSVKVLVNMDVSREDIFMSEVTTLSNASHRHLSKFYGYCYEHNFIALVYEYMENGSFAELLFQNPPTIEWDKCYDIAIKTGKAIAYLHDGCVDQIIHRDLKASNVLLDKNYSPKVADFGVAKLIKDGMSHIILSNTNRGTPGYAAPEMFIASSQITCAVDVYSFGIMLFEILGRRKLLGRIWFPEHVWNKFKTHQLDDILEECGISENDKDKARTLAMVSLWCIQDVPKLRPSMSTVVKILIEMEFPVKKPITCPFRKRFSSSNQSSSVGK